MAVVCGVTNKKRMLGASMIEYALLVALVAVVSMVAVKLLGDAVKKRSNDIAYAVSHAGSGDAPGPMGR